MSFENLAIIEPVLQALQKEGYTEPTLIQEKSIPVILKRKDLWGCARTGTGKTAAFAIPIIQLLHEEKQPPGTRPAIRALVLTPTRELAIQVQESFSTYGQFTGIRNIVLYGGVSQRTQVQQLQKRPDIVIATPGRLLDLMEQGHVHLQQLQLLVLDEADRMLDMGFVRDVKRILARTPAQKQILFFSATMAPEIRDLAHSILQNPVKIEVTPVSSTAESIDQSLYLVEKKNKQALLNHLLEDGEIRESLVFTRTKHGADKLAKHLNRSGIRAEAIHGNKSQQARQHALKLFKARQIRVLVATDIAARGIDIEALSHVINFDLPETPENYVHRIGRTGRAGAQGKALSFCDPEEKDNLRNIQRLIASSIPVINDHPFPLEMANFETPGVHKTVYVQRSNRSARNVFGNRRNRMSGRRMR